MNSLVKQSHPCIFYFSTYKNIYEAILFEGVALACTSTLKLFLKACVPSDPYYPLGYLRCFNPRAHHKIYSTDSPNRHREDFDLIPTSASHSVTRLSAEGQDTQWKLPREKGKRKRFEL